MRMRVPVELRGNKEEEEYDGNGKSPSALVVELPDEVHLKESMCGQVEGGKELDIG